jgi:7 transmembrane helices usually fused to an inactive transglutaminase/Transglutaminase-like superfamily
MNSRTLSTIAIVSFLLLGGVLMGTRYYRLEQIKIAREVHRWELTYEADFEAVISAPQETAQVRLAMPFNTSHCRVLNLEQQPWNIPNPNLRADQRIRAVTRTRLLLLSTRQNGTYRATAKFLLRLSPRADRSGRLPLENLTPDARSLFTRAEETLPLQAASVRDTLQLVPNEAETDAERLQWIFTYCAGIDSTADGASDDVDRALTVRQGTPIARARTMVTLCRALRIPARLVTGFRVHQSADIQPHVWLEVFQNQAWVPFDPTDGWSLTLPMDFVPVRRGGDQIAEATPNISGLSTKYSIKRLPVEQSLLRAEIQHPVQIFNLTRLPVPMHKIMKILLLLPFAALITALVRNVIGVQTFGTFAPSLLAMSFIYAEWKTGLMILIVVVTVGLFGRSFLERLRLLMVPRLSIILTFVILCVVFGVSMLHYLLPTMSADAVLLPMVILTILIERFHVTVEEDGLVYALQLTVGTVVVAMLCFLVLGWDEVGDWVLTYPEVHFFTIAAFILLGRYAGYRLTELWRFRDLVEPSEPTR